MLTNDGIYKIILLFGEKCVTLLHQASASPDIRLMPIWKSSVLQRERERQRQRQTQADRQTESPKQKTKGSQKAEIKRRLDVE